MIFDEINALLSFLVTPKGLHPKAQGRAEHPG